MASLPLITILAARRAEEGVWLLQIDTLLATRVLPFDDSWSLDFLQFTWRLLGDFLAIPCSSVECFVTCFSMPPVIQRSWGCSAPS